MNIIHSKHTLKGKRQYMEDNIIIKDQKFISFTTILDGHGGKKCSEYMRDNLFKKFLNLMRKTSNAKVSLMNTIMGVDKDFMKKYKTDNSGSTCNSLYIDKKNNKFLLANLGDSRAILYTKKGIVMQISKDHKPTLPTEKKYIIDHGGFVTDKRVGGILSMSRALGDKSISMYLNKKPDIFKGSIKNIKYFVQASDGLYDVMSNKLVCDYINKLLAAGIAKEKIAQKLASYAVNTKKSADNTSVIITFF